MPDFILSTGGKPWIENFRNEEKALKAVNYRGYELTSIEPATAEAKAQFEKDRADTNESPKPVGPSRQVRMGGGDGTTDGTSYLTTLGIVAYWVCTGVAVLLAILWFLKILLIISFGPPLSSSDLPGGWFWYFLFPFLQAGWVWLFGRVLLIFLARK